MRPHRALTARAPLAAASALSLALAVACQGVVTDAPEKDLAYAAPTTPLYLVGSFDGSQNFTFYVRTLSLARLVASATGRPTHFTYFLNGAHLYLNRTLCDASGCRAVGFPGGRDANGDGLPEVMPDVSGSYVGAAVDVSEVLARWALVQQVVNEGHDVGSHSMFHWSGQRWGYGNWQDDLEPMEQIVEHNLFQPVLDAQGQPLFPRWTARSSIPGTTGATCGADAECAGGACLEVAPGKKYCSQACNKHAPCPAGFGCGGAAWTDRMDVCVPLPEYPVVKSVGTTRIELFRADGTPNPAAIAAGHLVPYRMAGYRAPGLEVDDGGSLWRVMKDRGYLYDSSQAGWAGEDGAQPDFWGYAGDGSDLWMFKLAPAYQGAPLPADDTYRDFGRSADQMRADYRRGILDRALRPTANGRVFSVLNHFSYWETDASGRSYYDAFADTVAWTALGCPSDTGAAQCPGAVIGSYREVALALDGNRCRAALDAAACGRIDACVFDGATGHCESQAVLEARTSTPPTVSCDYDWTGKPAENRCPQAWNGTGDGCDCGCQYTDPDCGAP